jgi:hypothetical protein
MLRLPIEVESAAHDVVLRGHGSADLSGLLRGGTVEVRVEWKHADESSGSFSQGDVLVTRCCSPAVARVSAAHSCNLTCLRATDITCLEQERVRETAFVYLWKGEIAGRALS